MANDKEIETSSKDGNKSDVSNPLFIHHFDHPGMVLVSKQPNGDNYGTWCRSMRISLSAKNKLGFVDGTVTKPSKKTDHDEFSLWQRCNDMILSWILNSLDQDIADSVIYSDTAHDIWEDLKERFSQSNVPRIFQIQRDIASLTQDQMSVAAYYTRLKGLWDELASYSDVPTCTCGAMKDHAERDERNRVMQFLMGLNDSYAAARGQILLMQPLPSIRNIYSLISQEEKQRQLGTPHTTLEPAAMDVRQHQGPSNSNRKPLHCTHCDRDHHTIDTCYKLHGYPPGHRLHKSNRNKKGSSSSANHVQNNPTMQELKSAMPNLSDSEYQQILTMMNDKKEPQTNSAGLSYYPLPLHRWLIDSGATDHITSTSHSFTSTNNNPSIPPVVLLSGEKASIISVGNASLNSSLSLNNVLYVPSFKVNLMSVSKLTQGLHCSISFFPNWCILQDLATRKTIGLGKQQGGLYYLVSLVSDKPSLLPPSCNHAHASTHLWHSRLGHPSSSRLQFLAKNVLHFPFSNNACEVCPLAKQTRLPFHLSSISSSKPFSLIHCDIWGPHKIASFSGARYFLTIVDDFTRFTWLFLMQNKSETQNLLKSFFAFVQTQFNTHVQQIRVDNGGEFSSMRRFFHEHGVIFQHTCVYTPQQNGVVERKHRHIIEMARALRFQANLPISFWGECVLTAIYLINRLPTALLSKISPYEKLYHKPPSYTHLRVFGCLAYATIVQPSHKFDPRAKRCVFLGYPFGQKAYKLFDLTTKKIFTSRDVVFHESHFPFQTLPSSSLTEPPPPVLPLPLSDLSSPPCISPDLLSPHPPSPSTPPDLTASFDTAAPIFLSDTTAIPAPSPPSSPSVPPAPIRHSLRHKVKPAHLHDYVCSQVTLPTLDQSSDSLPCRTKGTRYPLSNFLSYHRYSPSHFTFIANISRPVEPNTFAEAVSNPHWQEAMQSELAALESNQAWSLTSLPLGKQPIGCK